MASSWQFSSASISTCVALSLLVMGVTAASAAQQDEFFEKKIRPLLAQNCYQCHSGRSQPIRSGLRLDTSEGVVKGGSRGPALVPGNPGQSLLLKAVSYKNPNLKMPPTGKLSDDLINDLIAWVEMGAPDPRTEVIPVSAAGPSTPDFEAGRQFWFFQDVQKPHLPTVVAEEWPRVAIDHFILADLEKNNLAPAPPADRRTWIRRVTFDLTGLPPTPQEIESFLSDSSPQAHEEVVDRLLSSPHYGERWARHWLDLVRFAETNGHEYDNDKLDSWRYRDYVIRAFNDDVPYDQFVKEHIAGDLIGEKRLSRDGSHWESPLGTAFYWFGEVLNSATDSVKSRADEVDNQIDVMGKAFLGLTVACARCHDHKFDPLPTSDYYSLAGIMHSTRVAERVIDSPSRQRRIASLHQKVTDTNQQIRELLDPARLQAAGLLKDHLLAAAELVSLPGDKRSALKTRLSGKDGLNSDYLEKWITNLEGARQQPDHIFHPFTLLAGQVARGAATSPAKAVADIGKDLGQLASRARARLSRGGRRGDIVYEDFEKLGYPGWSVSGQAFGTGPTYDFTPNQSLPDYQGQGLANSFGGGSNRLMGSLTSQKFKMPKLYLHVRMSGSKQNGSRENSQLRVTLVADGHKSQHFLPEGNQHLEWKTIRMTKEVGRTCYLEIVDRSPDGYIVVDRIVLSDSREPPAVNSPNTHLRRMLAGREFSSLEGLATAYQELLGQMLTNNAALDRDARWLVSALSPSGRSEDFSVYLDQAGKRRLSELRSVRQSWEAKIPGSTFAMVAADESPHNVRVHVRGNHKNLGEEVPRQFLRIIAGSDQAAVDRSSGRLQLAEWLASPEHPQAARVMVNRLWKHHLGQGMVRTPDNFGYAGERPTHPRLLDYLADQFVENGWSIKNIQRTIVLSSTYRMSGRAHQKAKRVDPQNRLHHHIPVRRLEAEAIRDSILSVAGTLNRSLYGPSVAPHISEYQDGRGKPESGPLDGEGRRSIYIQVRRNFITPMFLAFDYPLPISTMGRRTVSTVPSQALLMMNNEFVTQQASEWAERVQADHDDGRTRVPQMYLRAFGRYPQDWEVADALAFVETQRLSYQELDGRDSEKTAEQRSWADLCHVLLNSPEFIYIQ